MIINDGFGEFGEDTTMDLVNADALDENSNNHQKIIKITGMNA